MKISIIIPLYNKRDSIRRAIFSALDQDDIEHDQVDVIVVDDGSTDGSAEAVEAIIDENPLAPISLVRQENAGVSVARNTGVATSNAEYVCFLDSDDSYTPNFLKEIKSLIGRFPDAALYGTSYSFVCTGAGTMSKSRPYTENPPRTHRLIDNYFKEAALSDLPFCASSFGMSRKRFLELGQFPVGENMGEDQDLYIRAALSGPIAHSNVTCANYYIDVGDSLMQSVAPDAEMPYSRRLQEVLARREISTEFIEGAELLISGHLTDLARRNILTNNKPNALKILSDPRSRKRPIKWLYWMIRARL